MEDMEMWGYLTEQSERKVLRMTEAGMEITDTENYFGRPVLGKILILPRVSAQEFFYHKPWACISISDATSPYTKDIPEAEIITQNLVDVIKLKFDDISKLKEGYKRITLDQARQIMEFVDRVWDKIELLMIHCNAGLCRSPACGQVISEKYQPDFASFYEDLYHPNEAVVRALRAV